MRDSLSEVIAKAKAQNNEKPVIAPLNFEGFQNPSFDVAEMEDLLSPTSEEFPAASAFSAEGKNCACPHSTLFATIIYSHAAMANAMC